MHPSVMQFVGHEVAARNLGAKPTLEVGSLNVNGTPRQFFTGSYLGIDMRAGSGVDQVIDANDLWMFDRQFEVIVCTEMLEHDDSPWDSLKAMAHVCMDGGHLLLTCRGFDHRGCFPVHNHPDDLWRFSCDGLEALLWQTGWRPEFVKPDPEAPGVFAVAIKRCD